MAVQAILWANLVHRYDIHLVPGMAGPRLDHLIVLQDTLGNRRADSPHPGVAVAFAGAPAVPGVTLAAATGEVTVPAALAPGGWPRSMVVTCTVTEGANTFTLRVRVTVHLAIDRIWLNPARFNAAGVATSGLTVRDGARVARFSLLARFTDGEVADISNWSPIAVPAAADRTFVHLTLDNRPAIAWSVAGAGMTINAETGTLTCSSPAANVVVTAAIKPLPAPPNLQAVAPAVGAAPWATAVRLTLIDGPGFARMADVRNVLILPDGFDASQRGQFEGLARAAVNRINNRSRTRPFDLLKDQFNYFMAWVESPDTNITVHNELALSNIVGNRAEGAEFAPAAKPAIAGRTLVNEVNTAFHLKMGFRPAEEPFGVARMVIFHPFRVDDADFDAFLGALTNPSNASVGAVWARLGKDEALIAILCRATRTGGSNGFRGTGRYIAMTLDERREHQLVRNDAGNGFDLPAVNVNQARARITCWTRIAHEIAHSFRLLDEYGGSAAPLNAQFQARIDASANTQRRALLLTGANLDADRIKWRWPRICKAGVLTGNPVPAGARFRCTLKPGHAAAFAIDDIVRFRTQNLLGPAVESDRLRVKVIAGNDVTLELVAGSAAPVLATFPRNSILMMPRRAAAAPPALGDDLKMVHASIHARINATRNPLNALPADPANRACTAGSVGTPTRASNFVGGVAPNPPIHSSWIVGLFENGAGFDCNVYHPTGVCVMRTLTFADATTSSGSAAYQFCPICQYGIVDLIDPSKHREIDHDYQPRYPR